jgi:hypothetical protein
VTPTRCRKGERDEENGRFPLSNPQIAESARFVDCLEIGYPYAYISCSGARAVSGGEHGGRLARGGSWLLKRTLGAHRQIRDGPARP